MLELFGDLEGSREQTGECMTTHDARPQNMLSQRMTKQANGKPTIVEEEKDSERPSQGAAVAISHMQNALFQAAPVADPDCL